MEGAEGNNLGNSRQDVASWYKDHPGRESDNWCSKHNLIINEIFLLTVFSSNDLSSEFICNVNVPDTKRTQIFQEMDIAL